MKGKATSKIVWQGSSWRLREEQMQLADGSTYVKGIVEHPGAVVLVPYENGRVYMIRQYRLALDQTILELPAGTRDWKEEWATCAQRELREEIGFRAEQFVELGRIWPAPGMSSEEMVIYLATGLTPDPLPADPDEEIEVTPMPLGELTTMAADGRIWDAKSIIGLTRAAAHLFAANT